MRHDGKTGRNRHSRCSETNEGLSVPKDENHREPDADQNRSGCVEQTDGRNDGDPQGGKQGHEAEGTLRQEKK